METVTDFIFLGSEINAAGDFNHEIEGHLLLGRKVITNLDSIFREGNGTPLQYCCLENPMDGQKEIGRTFEGVLEDAGVYPCTKEGRAAFLRFAKAV